MFREMRRIKQKLSAEESSLILERNTQTAFSLSTEITAIRIPSLSAMFSMETAYIFTALKPDTK